MNADFQLIILIFLLSGLLTLVLLYLKIRKQLVSQTRELSVREDKIRELEISLDAARKEAEKLASQSHSEVDEMVKEQSEIDFRMKRALKKSEDASFMKNAFISSISQEIRTPLNNIIGFSSLLEAETSILENRELLGYAQAISESGDRLLSILNNLIDISKIESHNHQLSLKPTQINNIIANTVQLYLFKANEKKLKLNFIPREIPAAVIDEKSLGRALSIVVENAVKFTEKGFVNVSTDYQTGSNEVTIRIKDSGIGIDPAFQPDLFNPFRHESAGFSKETQGAGLGLPLAKSLIDLMRGTIRLESSKEEGTTVTISLPCEDLQKNQEASRLSREQKIRALLGLEIFIVEDDMMNKLVLYQMTKGMGNVASAMNGDDTMKIMEARMSEGKLFDIMLFDINLPPPWDGIKLMQEIRSRWKEYRKIPFIAQTAYAMVGDKEKLLAEGFDDYISKPINQQELYTIMKNQLNKF